MGIFFSNVWQEFTLPSENGWLGDDPPSFWISSYYRGLFGWLVVGRVYDTMPFEGMIMVFLEVEDH